MHTGRGSSFFDGNFIYSQDMYLHQYIQLTYINDDDDDGGDDWDGDENRNLTMTSMRTTVSICDDDSNCEDDGDDEGDAIHFNILYH